MTKYEKEILQAQLDLEEKIGRDLKAALQKALNKTARKVKELQLSEIMEKLPEAAVFSVPDTSGEPRELPQQRGQVYQAQYQQEITEYVEEPIQALETETQEIVKRSFWGILRTRCACYDVPAPSAENDFGVPRSVTCAAHRRGRIRERDQGYIFRRSGGREL